jgi:hypothetical protein
VSAECPRCGVLLDVDGSCFACWNATPEPDAKDTRPAVAAPGWTNGAELLDDVRKWLCVYVAWPSAHAAVAVTLWAAHTHLDE